MDLIEKNAAIDIAMQYCPDDDGTCSKGDRDIRELLDDLENLPSAQPEVIRCKDCEWWTKQSKSLQGRCELMQMYPTGEWFCGNAKKRVKANEQE